MTHRQERLLAWALPMAAVVLAAGVLMGRAAESATLGWCALICAAVAVIISHDRLRLTALLLGLCSLGFLLGQSAYHPALPAEGSCRISGIITGEIRTGANGQIKTELRHVTLNGRPAGNAYWSFYLASDESIPPELLPGARVTMTAKVYHPQGQENPGGYDFREYLLQRGITIGVYGRDELTITDAPFTLDGTAAQVRHRLSQGLTDALGREAGGYASAMLLGVTDLVPTEDREAFSRLGIAHVLSISGFHVGVLAAMVMMLLRRFHPARWIRVAVVSAVLTIYCILTGMHAPVVRAALLWLLHEYGALRQRQRSGLHLLSASFVLMLLVSPCQLTGASFQLTYGAMLGITLITPQLQRIWEPATLPGKRLWSALCAALGAQIGLLPAQLYWFGELPVLGLALNLVVFALAGGLMALYWLVLALLPLPFLPQLLGSAAAWITAVLMEAVRNLGSSAFIVLWTKQAGLLTCVGWVLVLLALSLITPLRGRRRGIIGVLGVVLILLSLMPAPHASTEYIQFSAGNADAALFHDRDMVVVVDTGEEGHEVSGYLHQRRLDIDALVLTHLHRDHAGGIAALLADGIPVARCYLPVGAEEANVDAGMLELLEQLTATGTEVIHLGRGDEIALPSGKLTVLWPETGRTRPGQEANLSSMALLADVKGTTLLLTGDLDGVYEDYAAIPADVLKVAHHGSASSTSAAFAQAVSPQTLILSTGDEERLPAVMERTGNIPAYATESSGAITLRLEENRYTVITFR